MQIFILVTGRVDCLYDECIDLAQLGKMSIRRASYVEPDDRGRWWADLSLVDGPRIGPFSHRSDALDAERCWLERHIMESQCDR